MTFASQWCTIHVQENPSDYGSRNPPPRKDYTRLEREDLGIKEDEEDMEVMANCVEEIILEAMTVDVLRQYSQEDNTITSLMKDVQKRKAE